VMTGKTLRTANMATNIYMTDITLETGILWGPRSKRTAVSGLLAKNCWYFCSPGRT
jgi:hypothetical protein